jgi:hypothetical protein
VSRTRVGLGIVAVAVGMAWALGGTASLAMTARSLAEFLPLLLLLAGVSAIFLVIVPRGALAGPVLLISMGLLGLAIEDGTLRKPLFAHVPALILISTGVIVAMSRREGINIDTRVKRFTTILFPRRLHLSGEAPLKLISRAIFGLLQLDMSGADPPHHASRVWVDVTCLVGRVELIMPKGWEVQAGRVDLARHMTFGGELTRTDIATQKESAHEPGKYLVVINVIGWGGVVRVRQN